MGDDLGGLRSTVVIGTLNLQVSVAHLVPRYEPASFLKDLKYEGLGFRV